MSDCSICGEKYNKTQHKKVVCLCEKECCRACVKNYIVSRSEDAHCMFCKVKWNLDFLNNNLEKSYILNDYKKHRENILYEKELGLLPATQPYVEKEIKIEQIREDMNEIEKQIKSLNLKLFSKCNEIKVLENTKEVERKTYIRKCPNNSCLGFLSSQLKCELCNVWVCSECREIKGDRRDSEHVCDPNILESVKFLNNDTKPCPHCSAMIHKIEGCNQMFCTECHTAFDWRTLRIETGIIHNPHFFQWQRTQNTLQRNPNEILCGRELDNFIFLRIKDKFVDEYNSTQKEPKTFMNELYKIIFKNTPEFLEKIQLKVNNIKPTTIAVITPFYIHQKVIQETVNFYNRNRDINDIIINMTLAEIYNIEPYNNIKNKINSIENIIRNTSHIRQVEMTRWLTPNGVNNNISLRVLYMRNKITTEDFKIKIQRIDKQQQRDKECENLLRMYVSCMTDLVYRIHDNIQIFDEVVNEMHELRKYTNNYLLQIFKTYNSTMRHNINDKFEYCIM